MEHSPSWEANRSSASQEIPAFYGTRRFITTFTSSRRLFLPWARLFQSIPPSHFKTLPVAYQRISPSPRPSEMFRNIVTLYGEVLLAPRRNSKLECHPLSAVRDCLLNIFAATLFCISGGAFLHRSLGTSHAVVTWTHLSWLYHLEQGWLTSTHTVVIYFVKDSGRTCAHIGRGGDWI